MRFGLSHDSLGRRLGENLRSRVDLKLYFTLISIPSSKSPPSAVLIFDKFDKKSIMVSSSDKCTFGGDVLTKDVVVHFQRNRHGFIPLFTLQ